MVRSEKLQKVIQLLMTEKTEVDGKVIERKRMNFTGEIVRLNDSVGEETLNKLLDGTAVLQKDEIVEIQSKEENDPKSPVKKKVLKKLTGNEWISPVEIK